LKVPLDECVDSRLTASLGNFEVRTVADEGWVGISNGQLLSLADAKFDVFVTVDRNLPFQLIIPVERERGFRRIVNADSRRTRTRIPA